MIFAKLTNFLLSKFQIHLHHAQQGGDVALALPELVPQQRLEDLHVHGRQRQTPQRHQLSKDLEDIGVEFLHRSIRMLTRLIAEKVRRCNKAEM